MASFRNEAEATYSINSVAFSFSSVSIFRILSLPRLPGLALAKHCVSAVRQELALIVSLNLLRIDNHGHAGTGSR
jgi:hypothetical protein